jgi:hypothetical protein
LYVKESGNATNTGWAAAGSGGSGTAAISTKTTTYSTTTSDYTILADASSASFTITILNAVGNSGRIFVIKKINSANIVTVATSGGTIDGDSTVSMSDLNDSITVQSDGTNWYII